MKKTTIILLCLAACLATAAVLCGIFGVFDMFLPQIDNTPVAVVKTPEPSPSPTQEPTQAPEPTPVPIPEPLGLEKNDLSFSALAPTTLMAFEELVGDNGIYDDESEIPPPPPAGTYKMVINEYHQFITVFAKDDAGEYTVPVRYMVATTGSRSLPTPKGEFTMGSKYVRFGCFYSYGVYGQYWRDITGNIFCHSLIYSSKNANSYTISYNKLGTRASHGCVRMFVPDARWVYYNIAPGTSADIIRGDKEDTDAAAIKEQFIFPERPDSRPGLRPGQITITEAWPGWEGDAYSKYLETIPDEPEEDDPEGLA